MDTQLSLIRCASYEPSLVSPAVKKAIDLLGGIATFVRPASRVLVKPNLLMATAPERGITTHPEVVRGVVRALKEINCEIFIGDGPSVWGNLNINDVYQKTGIKDVAAQEGAELVVFDKRRWHKKFPLTLWADKCDHIISIPKFKTHEITLLTAGIKNLFGLVSAPFKTELHKRYFKRQDFSRILVDIYAEVRPELTVIDGIVSMEGDGPGTGGKLRDTGFILAGADCLAVDSILALIMGLAPEDIPTNKEASLRGLGVADLNSIQILGDRLKDLQGPRFQLPAASLTSRLPAPVVQMLKGMIRFYPKIEHRLCKRCGACAGVCPQKVIYPRDKRMFIAYGGCISCFCCQECCPASAIKIKKSLLARLIGL